MAKAVEQARPAPKASRPLNTRGYQGGEIPPGQIIPPKGPAADVPVKRKDSVK